MYMTRDGAAAMGPELVETKREPASSATYLIDLLSTIDRGRFYRLPATASAVARQLKNPICKAPSSAPGSLII